MKLIDRLAAQAFMNLKTFKRSNTRVEVFASDTLGHPLRAYMYLYDTLIAVKKHNCLLVSLGNCNAATTRNRLNAIPGVQVNRKAGKTYLNGRLWEHPENLTLVKP